MARDDISDIMVNGAGTVFIEVAGRIQRTGIRFRDNQQLLNICQRIVSQVGRRVDESSPICDARLADGSRVNAIVPPLALDGPALTIRKFKKDKLTLDQLVKFGAISPEGAEILQIIGRCRANVLISGGTGSGKTTLLNCMTNYIDDEERVITCEDAAELQLQQPHVVRLETRPPNIEGEGQITMRELVRNCLRMRPERIIVGEVRGPEAFDLLQAMNTGHDGSMGTLHANNPREALSRCESMITMGGFSLPSRTIREMICASIDVIIQAARLRDGSRRITHITEVMGMEGDTIITQDLFLYDLVGEDANGHLIGRHRSTGIGRPRFWIAPGITAKRSGWPQRSTPPKSSQNPRGGCHEDTSARTRLPRRHRDRRRCLGLYLSPAVGGEESREPPGVGGQVGADRRACRRQEPADAPRAGRVVAEGARGAPAEGKQGDPEHPSHASGARLDHPEIHDRLRHSCGRLLCWRPSGRRRAACGRGPRLRRRLRPAALGFELSEESAGKRIFSRRCRTPST